MQILEGEIELREDTRVAEQARPALDEDAFKERGEGLSERQGKFATRCIDLADRIRELKEGEQRFGKEIALLNEVNVVMEEAEQILGTPDTGAPAVAAETEAIELMLKSKRINPKGGGGGGSSPGGGGGGDTSNAAIALVGKGVNEREVRKPKVVAETTGKTESKVPEEFRAGLDQYFDRISEESR